MPLYVYKCETCGRLKEDIRLIEERHDGPKCEHCVLPKMVLQISPVRGFVKNPAVARSRR